jgi:hypothetical protein
MRTVRNKIGGRRNRMKRQKLEHKKKIYEKNRKMVSELSGPERLDLGH